jgi:hypothetical protein
MKSHALLRGSGTGLAAIIQVDTTVSFLLDRQQVIDLAPILPSSNTGYVWKRVFLRGGRHRA